MTIRGKLIIIGGAEDKGDSTKRPTESEESHEQEILARIIEESKHKKNSRVEIVTSASSVPHEIGKDYIRAFGKLDAKNVGVLIMESRDDAAKQKNIDRLEAADVVFVTGGDQLRLTSVIGGTPFFFSLAEKLKDKDFIYAGTSAGAAVASDTMIMEGSSASAINKGEIKTAAGFGLIDNTVFDTHFVTRGRIGRLFQIIVSNPQVLGVGLEENSALLITNNKSRMEAIGPGMCILVDGRSIKNTNLLEIREGIPLSIDNLVLHVMSKTDVYDLNAHKLSILTPEECKY